MTPTLETIWNEFAERLGAFEFDRRGRVIDCEPRRDKSCPECGPANR